VSEDRWRLECTRRNDDENGFSLSLWWEHIGAREPPLASFYLRMAEQQVNAAHMENALIIKESSSRIVPPLVMAISELITLFSASRLSSAAPLIRRPSHKSSLSRQPASLLSGDAGLIREVRLASRNAGDNASAQQAPFLGKKTSFLFLFLFWHRSSGLGP